MNFLLAPFRKLGALVRSVHQDGTPDSWGRWSGTIFLLTFSAVVIITVLKSGLTDILERLLEGVGFTVIGGATVRKGAETIGQIFGNKPTDPPTTPPQ